MKRMIRASANVEIDSEGNVVPEDIAEELRNSKIRNRAKHLIVCYHGTSNDFSEFKEEFISQNSGNFGWFGKGFYFTNLPKLAQSYGNIQKKCYLNITNPFVYSSEDAVYELLARDIKYRSYKGRLQPYAYQENPDDVIAFTEMLKKAGYDGVKYSYRQAGYEPNIRGVSSAIEFVCFRPDQICFLD